MLAPSQWKITDDNTHVLFPTLQVDVAISLVRADAGDPRKVIARLVSVQQWETWTWNGHVILIPEALHTSGYQKPENELCFCVVD